MLAKSKCTRKNTDKWSPSKNNSEDNDHNLSKYHIRSQSIAKTSGLKEFNKKKLKEKNSKKSRNYTKKCSYKKEWSTEISSKISSDPNKKRDKTPSKKPANNIPN